MGPNFTNNSNETYRTTILLFGHNALFLGADDQIA